MMDPNFPKSGVYECDSVLGGLVYEYTNQLETSVDIEYASFTAPIVTKCIITIDNNVVDTVWAGAGGSHSWWHLAGGRLLRYPLKPKQTLKVVLSGIGAFRISWYENY